MCWPVPCPARPAVVHWQLGALWLMVFWPAKKYCRIKSSHSLYGPSNSVLLKRHLNVLCCSVSLSLFLLFFFPFYEWISPKFQSKQVLVRFERKFSCSYCRNKLLIPDVQKAVSAFPKNKETNEASRVVLSFWILCVWDPCPAST